jgi:hypothetical protein
VDDADLAALGQPDEPPVSFSTAPSRNAWTAPEVDLRRAERDARGRADSSASVMTFARCSSALDGMQPDVEADAASRS